MGIPSPPRDFIPEGKQLGTRHGSNIPSRMPGQTQPQEGWERAGTRQCQLDTGQPQHRAQASDGDRTEAQGAHWDRHRAPFPSHSSTISLKVMSGLDTGTNILLLSQPFGCHKKLPATFPQSGCNFFSWLEIGAVIKVSSCLPI